MSMKALRLLHKRLYSTPPRALSQAETHALDAWIASPKQLVLTDTFTPERVADLYVTLPTRSLSPSPSPHAAPEVTVGAPLSPGHHLAFFHPRNPESALRPDGSDADFCPPPPFTRRMWAGGRIAWCHHNNTSTTPALRIGDKAVSRATVASVEKKGFDVGSPMVFVKQRIEITPEGGGAPSIVEERSHVYIADSVAVSQVPREVKGIPPSTDFSFTFTPSPITLFRFSALTFNAHHIHLDREYAQVKEGYPERLVHGPLTALLLLETTLLQLQTQTRLQSRLQTQVPNSETRFAHFEYRARNPIVVNRPLTIAGSWTDARRVSVWAVDGAGVVGMTGEVELASN
ncbi:hypothetical protein B0H12DRAFT_591701 [Mycena haematopus]|nr:hypothetical protein B0H12DRAFT_591701 [Mycena haematopus]